MILIHRYLQWFSAVATVAEVLVFERFQFFLVDPFMKDLNRIVKLLLSALNMRLDRSHVLASIFPIGNMNWFKKPELLKYLAVQLLCRVLEPLPQRLLPVDEMMVCEFSWNLRG